MNEIPRRRRNECYNPVYRLRVSGLYFAIITIGNEVRSSTGSIITDTFGAFVLSKFYGLQLVELLPLLISFVVIDGGCRLSN